MKATKSKLTAVAFNAKNQRVEKNVKPAGPSNAIRHLISKRLKGVFEEAAFDLEKDPEYGNLSKELQSINREVERLHGTIADLEEKAMGIYRRMEKLADKKIHTVLEFNSPTKD